MVNMGDSMWIGSADELDKEPDEWASIVGELEDGCRLLKMSSGEWVVHLPETYGFAYRFNLEKDARLLFGLWKETGGFSTGQSPSAHVPIEVATQGKDALAAYLLVGTGVRNSRGFVASKLGVSEQTVSNYANRVRWSE